MMRLALFFGAFSLTLFLVHARGSLDLLEILRYKIEHCGTHPIRENGIAGPTYIRWGQTKCGEESDIVYDGYAAGKKYNSGGSGANYLCLTKTPEWGNLKHHGQSRSTIYGVEADVTVFTPSITEKDMPCVVCQVKRRSSVLMIPGRKSCPRGWTREYWGYLMSEFSTQKRTTSEYVCVDNEPVGVPGGDKDNNDAVWYLVGGKCGSLKCPPYVDGKELTCVVCSQ